MNQKRKSLPVASGNFNTIKPPRDISAPKLNAKDTSTRNRNAHIWITAEAASRSQLSPLHATSSREIAVLLNNVGFNKRSVSEIGGVDQSDGSPSVFDKALEKHKQRF